MSQPGTKFEFAKLVEYAPGSVVSKTIIKKPSGTVTVFAFDEGEGLSEHTSPHDALVQMLEGRAVITVGGNVHELNGGESLILPAEIPHALKAVTPFKMLLTMIR